MKIVYVFRSLAVFGGIERILVDKMNWLVAHGYEVSMITADQGQHPLAYPMDSRIRFTDLNICYHHQYRYKGLRRLADLWQRRRRFARLLKEQLKAERPDVIVCTTANYVDILTRLKGNTPLIVESHSLYSRLIDTGRFRLIRRWWRLKALQKAQLLVALTDEDAAAWRQCLPHVETIPNMVHVPEHLPQAALTNRRVIFAGRFAEQKQLNHLLIIWQKVHLQHPDWTLAVYGDGEQRDWFMGEVARLNAGIEVFPPTADIFKCYAESSVLMLTSVFEPFGLVMPEAMLCGVPVVAYDCPFGPHSIITDGKDGFLVRPQDTDAFARRLCQLIVDEELRQRMGKHARESARRFEVSHVMPLWERLFQQVKSK